MPRHNCANGVRETLICTDEEVTALVSSAGKRRHIADHKLYGWSPKYDLYASISGDIWTVIRGYGKHELIFYILV